jgi:hypothetical protein
MDQNVFNAVIIPASTGLTKLSENFRSKPIKCDDHSKVAMTPLETKRSNGGKPKDDKRRLGLPLHLVG